MRWFLCLCLLLSACDKSSGSSPLESDTGDDADSPSAPSAYEGDAAGECDDGVDNDDDGTIDCEDEGCQGAPACTESDADADADTDDTGDLPPAVSPTPARLSTRDYGFLYWPGNHWTSWGTFDDVQHVQTGYYGLAFDMGSANINHIGLIADAVSAEEALTQDNSIITALPGATVEYAILSMTGGFGEERVANGFLNRDGTSSNPSELSDMGRFMQRTEIPMVTYEGTATTGSVQLAAMTRHFVLTHRATPALSAENFVVKITLRGEALSALPETEWIEDNRALTVHDGSGEGWTFIVPEREGMDGTVRRFPDGTLIFEGAVDSPAAGETLALSVIVIPTNTGGEAQRSVWLNPSETVNVEYAQLNRDGSGGDSLTEATWDPERGLYQVNLSNLTAVGAPTWPSVWSTPSNHNWYNRHRLVVSNDTDAAVSIPIGFNAAENAAFYITGGIPLLRSVDGEPIGAPVQISKNWHDPPAWYHLYSALLLDPGRHEYEHTFAHSKWGEAYAVQHAQLSLIGWGHNQQWDESSIGCWGESITYDPDMTLARAQVDDVRPFLVDADGEWRWTGNVGGASFLVYRPAEGISSFPSHQLGRMRTHYAYTGPNLTKVIYSGLSRDGKIEATVTTQLGRTDDLVRAYYHLEYTILEDVNYNRIAFFQVAADRYGDNGFTRYAYGDEDGVLFDAEVFDHMTTGYASDDDRGIAMTGESPWVMLYGNARTGDSLPEHLANVGFVVREYEAVLGDDAITTPHINMVRTSNGGWSQMGFELGIPHDATARVIPAGSTIRATVEYLVPPADKGAYYGEADYLTEMPADSYQSTDMMWTLAADNHLEISAEVGTVTRVHPVELNAADGTTAVEFTLTGGLGYTPVTIHGLARPDGWQLERREEGTWEPIDQSVEGNDYWQADDDPALSGFTLVFNVHNRGTHTYRLVRP